MLNNPESLPTLFKSFCQMRPAGYSFSGAASSRTHETNLAVFLLRTFPPFSPLQRGLRFEVITSYPNTSSHRSGLITLICSNSYPLLADSILLRHIHICLLIEVIQTVFNMAELDGHLRTFMRVPLPRSKLIMNTASLISKPSKRLLW